MPPTPTPAGLTPLPENCNPALPGSIVMCRRWRLSPSLPTVPAVHRSTIVRRRYDDTHSCYALTEPVADRRDHRRLLYTLYRECADAGADENGVTIHVSFYHANGSQNCHRSTNGGGDTNGDGDNHACGCYRPGTGYLSAC